ncbi:MAG: extracellular solute-binding protein [Anaerolineae bacterium]|nr:extracellular solute-binding protein [Anaerolineae bacterium]MDW8172998.1 extracellular solute-binding protein [Anaerolineae bacterium]
MLHTKKLLVMALAALAVLPSAAQDKIEIKFWHIFQDDNRLGWSRGVAEEFNKLYPQYNVTVEAFENYEVLLNATEQALEQGTAPAIVQYFEVATQRARDLGFFKPVQEALAGREEVLGIPVDFEDFIQPVVNYYTLDGQFTSMPWNSSTPILYTNTAFLEAAGLEKPPATWQELEAACEAVMALPNAPQFCITWPNHGWFFEQWLAQQNAEIVNNGNGRQARATEVLLTSENAINIASWWKSMYDRGYYYYSGKQRDWTATEQAIQTGQTAFIITSSADARNITEAAAANGINIVTTRMPFDEKYGWTGNIIGGASLWLVDGLDPAVEEGALAFLLFLNNTENAASWHQATGYLPIRQSSVELLESQGWFEQNPNFFTASDQINNSQVTSATSGGLFGTFVETRNLVTQAIEDLMLKGGDVAERMAAAKAEADKLLADYNSLFGE